jgi:tetratricopeptide (TPR) repeat protein
MRSVWFRFHGDMDSAVVEAQRAHRLDPFSLMLERLLAKQLYYARRYDESRQAFLRMLQNSPSRLRGYRDLAQLSVATGHPREAVDWLHQALAADGDSVGAAALPTATSDDDAKRLLAREARRTIARMERAARAHERIMPATVASAYAALGDTAATLRWLDSIRIQHDTYLNIVRVDPAFDFLRNEPAYRAWDDRSGLPRMKALVEKLPP